MILLLSALALADQTVYDDALASGWSSWSWSGDYDFSSGTIADGSAAIACEADAWGALSLHSDAAFSAEDVAALRFLFAGDGDAVRIALEADGSGTSSDSVLVSDYATTSAGALTEVVVPLDDLGDADWTRIDWMDATGAGASFVVDGIELLSEVPAGEGGFDAFEPIGPRRLLLWGSGDTSDLSVTVNGAARVVTETVVETGPDRVYLTLDEALEAGTLGLTVGGVTWTRKLGTASATVSATVDHDISPLIYGQAFPEDYDGYLSQNGVSAVRWGGNAVTLYNPIEQVTNLAADWYFENSAAGSAEDWISAVHEAGAVAAFTVPALDYVAKDSSAYAYSVSTYGSQQGTDPYKPDAGNGVTSGGTEITWNDPADHATAWTAEQAADWVSGLSDPPEILFIDNELDIASETHRDVHPDPVTYDELVERWSAFATLLRDAAPDAMISGPSACCWWFYWNSAAGASDKAGHGGQDLLPYFLDQIAAEDAASGVRRLDIFDVHYYPDGVFNDDTDAATAALRLRSTRSLWDPSYTDEGWIGTDVWATDEQPDRNQVQLIPRMRALLDAHYPGTKLGLTEWNWGAEDHLSGGLAVADVLGIIGREGLDLAFYWTSPATGTPAAAAFQLYREAALPFGNQSRVVDGFDSDLLGVYAANDGEGRLTLVIVNKDPDQDVLLDLAGAAGTATVRHFGGEADGNVIDDGQEAVDGQIMVPAYAAVFLALGEGGDGGGSGGSAGEDGGGVGGEGEDGSATDSGRADTGGVIKSAECGCATTGSTSNGGLVAGLAFALFRRRRQGEAAGRLRIRPKVYSTGRGGRGTSEVSPHDQGHIEHMPQERGLVSRSALDTES